jgi:membrane protein
MKQVFVSRSKAVFHLLLKAMTEWDADHAVRWSASVAFYTLLSLAPLLVLIVSVAGLFLGRRAAQGQLTWQIENLLGPEVASAIQGLLHSRPKPVSGAIGVFVSIITLLFGASAVVMEVRDALNAIWRVPNQRSRNQITTLLRVVKERLYSFAVILGAGFLLLISLILSTFLLALGRLLGHLSVAPYFLQLAELLFSFLTAAFLFAAIYKVLPRVTLDWADVGVGAAVTSLLFIIGKFLISLYLAKASLGSAYGAAGSIIVVLVWVYYSAQVFFLGAEFTKVYTKTFGSHRL